MKQILKLYNLFYIFICIIWPPLQLYILKVDGAGRTIMIMSIIALLLNAREFWKQRKLFFTPAFLCWMVLLCYSMLNALSKGFYAEFGTFKFLRVHYFDTLVLLVIMMMEMYRKKKTCLWVIWISLGVYLLIGLPFISQDIGSDGRFISEGLGNLLSLHSISFLFVSSLLYVEKKFKTAFYVILCVLVSLVIIASATRKAFGAEVVLLIGVVLSLREKWTWKSWVRFIVLGVLFVIGIRYIMQNTLLGERLTDEPVTDVYVQLVENEKVNDALVSFLGDRAMQYEIAIDLYHEHILTGIGISNFMDVSGGDLVLHSEYMVQLCENGIIGFVLLLLFYFFLIFDFTKNKITSDSKPNNMVLFGLLAVLFINFTAWTYCQNFIMVIYAIVISYIYSNPNNGTTIFKKNSHTSPQEQLQ